MEHPQTDIFAEPTGDLGGIDADSLMEQVESGGQSDIPMSAPTEAPQAAAAPDPAAAPAGVQEVEFTWNGKQVKAPLDKAKQWAAQGYDYAQRMQEFNSNRERFEAEQKQLQERYGHYSAIDEFAKSNPDWWNHVSQSWEQRAAAAAAQAGQAQPGGAIDPSHPVVQEISALKSELSQIKEFKTSLEQERLNQQREQEDKAITEEIESIRKTYPDLDLSRVDESGKTLEMRVIEHALEHNIKSFKTAFHDFNHDRLMQLAEERGKQLAQKERQKQTKLGLLGKTQAPVKGISEPHNIKSKNYDDLLSESLAELGIS